MFKNIDLEFFFKIFIFLFLGILVGYNIPLSEKIEIQPNIMMLEQNIELADELVLHNLSGVIGKKLKSAFVVKSDMGETYYAPLNESAVIKGRVMGVWFMSNDLNKPLFVIIPGE